MQGTRSGEGILSPIRRYSGLLRLLRPRQWVKNLFVFLPAFFAGRIMDPGLLAGTGIAFTAFCLVASAAYIVNDARDRKMDRRHPVKRDRPLAADLVSVRAAAAAAALLGGFGLVLAFQLRPPSFLLIGLYLLMNLAYSLGLKHIPVLDVIIVAFGYVIRIYVGGVVGGVEISRWIVALSFLLVLFLAVGKRREDVLLLTGSGLVTRRAAGSYRPFVDAATAALALILLVAYSVYAVSSGAAQRFQSERLYLTTVFVLLGILRYLHLTCIRKESADPTELLYGDPCMKAALLGWIVTFAVIIYRG